MRRSCLVALLVTLIAPYDSRTASVCPAPSVEHAGLCVLLHDAILTDTMWIASGTQLNCRGYRLTPAVAGTLDDPRTVTNEFLPSQPELALFVHRSYDVKIQNCFISGFDFGIIVAQSKTVGAPASLRQTTNKILSNTIDVRTNPIDVIKSDNVLISDNRLTYASERGRGIVLDFDSDHNEILGNTVISTDAASTGQVRQLPGGPLVAQTAIMDNEIHSVQSDKGIQNFVVSGVLIQVPARDPISDNEDSRLTDHNFIQANDIIDLGVGQSCTLDPGTSCGTNSDCTGKGVCLLKQNSGIGFNFRAADSVVRDNRISGRMGRGLSFGGLTNPITVGWFPGVCSQDPSGLRMCSTDTDCNIPGYDNVSLGLCLRAGPLTINGNSMRLTAEGNIVSGVYETAALFANNSDHFVFRNNTIAGGTSGIQTGGTNAD
jgi:hypothetical protein